MRGNTQLRSRGKDERWFKRQELQASSKPEYLGSGTLARAEYAQCNGHFYLHKRNLKGEKINGEDAEFRAGHRNAMDVPRLTNRGSFLPVQKSLSQEKL